MKLIPLTKGYFTKVDDDDFKKLAILRWYANVNSRKDCVRAARFHNRKTIYLARVVMNAPDGKNVDHINGDTLDNRKSNLRLCSRHENSFNRKMNKNNKAGYKGAYWDKRKNKWKCCVRFEGKAINVGYFDNKKDAAIAYDKKAKELFGEFANINFPQKLSALRKEGKK